MAEQENGSSPLAEALARVGDRWTLLVVEALLGAAAPGRLPADRRGRRARRGAAPAGALGSQARRPGGSPPAHCVRHPSRGPLVLPDLRPPRRPRAPRRRGQLPVTPEPARPPRTLSSPESTPVRGRRAGVEQAR